MIRRSGSGRAVTVLMAAALSAGLLLSGCGAKEETKETTMASAETEASADSSEASEAEEEGTAASGTSEASDTETEELSVLHPYVERQQKADYDYEGSLLASTEYDIIGLHDEAKELNALSEALTAYNEERGQIAAITQDTLLEIAMEDAEESDSFYGYQSISGIEIKRADGRVFSFTDNFYDYTGGAHGNGGTTGISFDSKTGERLELSDLVSDKDALKDYVIAELETRYGADGGLFEGWQDTVRNDIDEVPYAEVEGLEDAEGNMTVEFALSASGLEIYFQPYEIGPYALGTITVEVPYTEESLGFSEAYLPLSEQSVWRLEPYEELSLDVDGDGTKEAVGLGFEVQEDESQSTYTVYVTDGEETFSVNGVCGYGMDDAYILRSAGGSYMLYGDCRSDNDWHYLSMVDLTALAGGEVQDQAPAEYYEAFYDNVPVSADSFYLSTRGSLISTVPERREHCVGQNGFPEALQDDFIIDELELTAKNDIKATDEDGNETEVPNGTTVKVVSTDEASYIVAELPDGKRVKIEINGESWPHTIGGTDIEDCFEGLIFAG
ncbi:MAG TPA: DUF3298 and DUF4163 domain-containing protein [Candidatus Avilachnospira avicola]|nr:DUF3298 and DUF4163 domain-containing protein [Candidatus Avilachnospira avicola]